MERNLLTSLLYKFSPETQEIKESSISKIVLNLIKHSSDEMTIEEVHEVLSESPYQLGLSIEQCHEIYDRLISQGDINKVEDTRSKFELSDNTSKELDKDKREFEKKISTLREFLSEFNVDIDSFLKVLYYVFSKIGEESIQVLTGKIPEEISGNESLISSATEIVDGVEEEDLRTAFIEFIKNQDPEIIEVKWLLAQNSFLLKLLGSGVDEKNFSETYFKDARFYLDTNVLLNAIEPNTRHHKSYNLIKKEISKINASFYCFEQNIEELETFLHHKREEIEEVKEYCPADIFKMADDFIAKQARTQIEREGKINIDIIFDKYADITDWAKNHSITVTKIEPLYNLDHQIVSQLTKRVQHIYKRKKEGRTKNHSQARIDAKLLLATHEVKKHHDKSWILTIDKTLPDVSVEGEKSLSLTVDALLHWLSIGFKDEENNFAEIYSNLLQDRLLPTKRYFKLEDFRLFCAIDKDVSELPIDDVVKCIDYVKEHVGEYDVSSAKGREKLQHYVSKYFSKPDLEYKKELRKKTKLIDKKDDEIKRIQQDHKDYREKTEEDIEKLNSQLNELIQKDEKRAKEKENRKELLKLSGITILSFILLNAILLNPVAYEVTRYADIKLIEGIIFAISVAITFLFDSRRNFIGYEIIKDWIGIGSD